MYLFFEIIWFRYTSSPHQILLQGSTYAWYALH